MTQNKITFVGTDFHDGEGLFSLKERVAHQKNPLLGLLLTVTFYLLPIYLYPSGGLQLVDIPMIFIMGMALLSRKAIDSQITKHITSLIPFIIWVILVNGGYFLHYSNDLWYLMTAGIMLYGLLLVYSYAIIFKRLIDSNEIKYVYLALTLSIIGCFSIKGFIEESRTVLSFNNPNQLAYFAVLLQAYTILLLQLEIWPNKKPIVFVILDVVFIFFAHFFVIASISRAGIIAILFLDFCLIKNFWKMTFIFPTVIAVLIIITFFVYIKPELIQERLSIHPEEDFTVDHLLRGRDGLFDRAIAPLKSINGLEILIGKGAGLKHERQVTHKEVIEVHNSFGEVLKSYGIIGLLLFSYWFIRLSWSSLAFRNGIWIMAALFAYNFGHMGLRFRSFWIFLGMFIVMLNISNTHKDGRCDYNKNK